MTHSEDFWRRSVAIDPDYDPWYGSDQMNNSYPVRFATVQFQMLDTIGLVTLADQVRKQNGFLPAYPTGRENEVYDENCWYDFYIGINDLSEKKCDNCITFYVVNSRQADDEKEYRIDLSPEEQNMIFRVLNEECRKHYGKSCEELLAEARAEMLET